MAPSTSNTSAFATRKDVPLHSATQVPERPSSNRHHEASAVLIVPIIDERHHGADLLMIPISDDNKNFSRRPQEKSSPSTSTPSSRTETPAAPTPPPKPQLPKGCDDWDSYLSQKKSTATLPLYKDEADWIKPTARIQSPELNFKHSFEQMGWRDCLNQAQRQKANAVTLTLRHRPSGETLAPTVYDGKSPSNVSAGAVSPDNTRRLSNASTLTTNTAAAAPFYLPSTAYKRLSNASTLTAKTAPCVLGGSTTRNAKRLSVSSTLTANTIATVPCYLSSSYKRLSNASTLTTSTFSSIASNGKPRSIRRINRARHLRTYYSDGSLLRGRRLSVGISSMQGIAERREPESWPARKRLSAASMPLVSLRGEFGAPPPYPPPEKPLPKLPVVEVRELHTGERTRWRELLLRSFPRMESSRRRAGSVTVR
ncbi:hypothetical protein N0V93_001796 [Gnomoniopsis smithogilvyi]|uniref:Uncharacterized protein n=1 Tax=Gnomoniopsis smithogilvyi TaxID=1191159 RepID=A0A9W9D2Y5_9PEZI|nr:hypothetical protein N0V93_001796 [Gnomoniopsis smithogilvyi]